jgi:biotin carboxyl carrier protein
MKLIATLGGRERTLELASPVNGTQSLEFGVDELRLRADLEEVEPGVYSVLIGGRCLEAVVEREGDACCVHVNGRRYEVFVRDPRRRDRRAHDLSSAGTQSITSPMPGKIVRVLVEPGDQISAGTGLLIVEAMKMQNEIRSPKAGIVTLVSAKEGASVAAGETMVIVE